MYTLSFSDFICEIILSLLLLNNSRSVSFNNKKKKNSDILNLNFSKLQLISVEIKALFMLFFMCNNATEPFYINNAPDVLKI